MSKSKVVIFTKNNARVVVTTDVKPYLKMPNAVVNPNLKKVIGVQPLFWKLEKGEIVEMNRAEKLARKQSIHANGVDSALIILPNNKVKKLIRRHEYNLLLVGSLLLGVCLGWLLNG